MSAPTFVPDTFLKRLLDEFGLQWTQLAIFAGVFISTFGWERYISAGPWIFGSVAGLWLASTFKPWVTWSFPATVLSVLLLALGIGGCVAVVVIARDVSALNAIKHHRKVFSAAIGCVVSVGYGFGILASKRDKDAALPALPVPIDQVLAELVRAPVYRDYHRVSLEMEDVTETDLQLVMNVEYILVNRTSEAVTLPCGINGKDASKMVCTYARVGEEFLDVSEPDFNTDRGFTVSVTVPADGQVMCQFIGRQHCYLRDSDVFTSFLFTGSFELRIKPGASGLHFIVTPWGPIRFHRTEEAGELRFRAPGALAPYTGARVHWTPFPTWRRPDEGR